MSIFRHLKNVASKTTPSTVREPSTDSAPHEPAAEVSGNEKLLLYLTATNFDHVIDDTQQLSVRRGASIYLRELTHKELPNYLTKKLNLKCDPISIGASIGLYEIANVNPEGFRGRLEKWLNEEPRGYFTFAYAIKTQPDMSEFPRLIRELQNEVNLTRQQTLSLSLAGLCNDDVGIGDPLTCHWEGLRPAKPRALTRKENGEDQSYHLSPSVASRYFSGRTYQGKDANSQIASIKKDFIKTETDGEVDKFFSYDLEQLGGFSNNASPFSNFSNLNNKMAVIYIDGNDFGAKRKTLETANDYREFDQAILSARKNFLIHLFKTWGGQEAFLNREIDAPEDRENEPHCRFELLQWGGDELLFIVPAWLGFPILRQFFQTPFEWNGKPLTHAAGMALCSIKTPISRAQALAIELAEWCKSVSRKENLYAALALESIDYPTQPLETFFEQRFHSLAQYHFPHRPFSGTAENWSQQLDSFEALKDGLPRARVIQHLLDLLEELREGGTCHPDAQHEQCFEKTANDLETILGENELNIHFDNWRTLFPAIDEVWLNSTALKPEKIQEIRHTLPSAQRIWPWLYLVEYWDYLLTDSTLGVEKKEAQNDQ